VSRVIAHPTLKLPDPGERFHLAERAGGIGTFVRDLIEGTWEWTPQVAYLFGLTPEAAASFEDWERLVFPDDVAKLIAALDEARRTGSYYTEFRIRVAGGVRWLAGKGAVDNDESGRPRWLCGVYYDISERKELEARLLAANETLEARVREMREEARLLEILNNTGAALAAELSLERLVQIVTDAAVSLSGAKFGAFFYNSVSPQGESYTLYALSGVPRSAFEKFPLPRNTAIFEPTFRGTGPVRSDDILADPRYGKNAPHKGMPPGHLPVRSYMALPVILRSGEVIGGLFFGHPDPGVFTERAERIVAGIAGQAATAFDNARLFEASKREVVARRQAEGELQRLNETLEERIASEFRERRKAEETLRQAQKMESIGQLTGGIAHDFNNLLTVISGNLEQLQRRLAPGADGQRNAAAALRGVSRAALLTQRLLAFSRRQPLQPKVVDPNSLILNISDLLRRTLGEAISIETIGLGGAWPILADAIEIENALINLAVNARDAMPEGGRLTLETANSPLDAATAAAHGVAPGDYVCIAVRDTGTGMPPEVVEKAFEPFFTTKDIGQGTGLGLSQVYGFVKQSGGHVAIDSQVGKGTTVTLHFPRHTGERVPEAAQSRAAAPAARDGETILVVEDDSDVRQSTTEMVRDLGYRVLSAEDGQAALRELEAHPEVRLLLTDVGLPRGMNGRQLADEALRRRPQLKVLFVTGYARSAIVHDGRLDPGVEAIFKPFNYADLGTRMRRVLDQ